MCIHSDSTAGPILAGVGPETLAAIWNRRWTGWRPVRRTPAGPPSSLRGVTHPMPRLIAGMMSLLQRVPRRVGVLRPEDLRMPSGR